MNPANAISAPRTQSQTGFTLLEMMLSLFVLAVSMLTTMVIASQMTTQLRGEKHRISAQGQRSCRDGRDRTSAAFCGFPDRSLPWATTLSLRRSVHGGAERQSDTFRRRRWSRRPSSNRSRRKRRRRPARGWLRLHASALVFNRCRNHRHQRRLQSRRIHLSFRPR